VARLFDWSEGEEQEGVDRSATAPAGAKTGVKRKQGQAAGVKHRRIQPVPAAVAGVGFDMDKEEQQEEEEEEEEAAAAGVSDAARRDQWYLGSQAAGSNHLQQQGQQKQAQGQRQQQQQEGRKVRNPFVAAVLGAQRGRRQQRRSKGQHVNKRGQHTAQQNGQRQQQQKEEEQDQEEGGVAVEGDSEGLSDNSGRSSDDTSDYSDLDDWIVCAPGRDYSTVLAERYRRRR
jgi:hypothetical protein